MQDDARQAQTEDERWYPVLSVGRGDFEDDLLEDGDLDDEQRARLDFVRVMSPEQWRHLADYMGEILFDGDRWEMALESALSREMEYAGVTADHQAMQEAAR
jgi:hypothetical protein